MICDQCGNSNPEGARFCEQCGSRLSSTGSLEPPKPIVADELQPPVPELPGKSGDEQEAHAFEETELSQEETRWQEETETASKETRGSGLPSWFLPAGGLLLLLALVWLFWPSADPPAPDQVPATEDVIQDVQEDNVNPGTLDKPLVEPDAASTDQAGEDAGAAEWQAAKQRFDAAYEAYTTLITTGGEGNVEEARSLYKQRLEELRAVEKKWGIKPPREAPGDAKNTPGIEPIR